MGTTLSRLTLCGNTCWIKCKARDQGPRSVLGSVTSDALEGHCVTWAMFMCTATELALSCPARKASLRAQAPIPPGEAISARVTSVYPTWMTQSRHPQAVQASRLYRAVR